MSIRKLKILDKLSTEVKNHILNKDDPNLILSKVEKSISLCIETQAEESTLEALYEVRALAISQIKMKVELQKRKEKVQIHNYLTIDEAMREWMLEKDREA